MSVKRKSLIEEKTSNYFKGTANSKKQRILGIVENKDISQGHSDESCFVGRLEKTFYDQPCLDLAKNLLGKKLVRKLEDGTCVSGLIVETEGYLGIDDKASHSYSGKITERNSAMFMPPGTTYVYMTYGMYYCLNISSRVDGCAVLLRALQPTEGFSHMKQERGKKKKDGGKSLKTKDLCNGPSKLCQSLSIHKDTFNKKDLTTCDNIWVENCETVLPGKIVTSTRIGIDGAGKEWAERPWRFYVKDSDCVSKRDKVAEENNT